MRHDTSRSAIEYGPAEPIEIPCPTCVDGEVSTGAFDKHAEHTCPDCNGDLVIEVWPEDIDDWDTRDHDVQKGDW